MAAKRRRHQFQMYEHQVQWYGPNLLELGGGWGREAGGRRPPGAAVLRAEGRKR